MELVEVVLGAATSGATIAAADVLVGGASARRRSSSRDSPASRPAGWASPSASRRSGWLKRGVAAAADIDRAMVLGYRHPIGPLRLTDLVGLDVRLDIARNLCDAYGERFAPPPLLETMVTEGRLGKKSGSGFFDWEES